MAIVTYAIDEYSVQVYANDLRGDITRWASTVIYLYSAGRHVGTAYFAREGYSAPEAMYANEKIHFRAQSEQYERVVDLLRNEKPVYLRWKSLSDSREPYDGDAYFYTGREPVGEEET